MDINSLKPKERLKVMDLVAEAGIDVSDWGNFKGGPGMAASNPKYCYEWVYEDHEKKLIVLNLWFENMVESDGEIIQLTNLGKLQDDLESSSQKKRAMSVDTALRNANQYNYMIRVIVCDGILRDSRVGRNASVVKTRLLDPEPWYIKHYNSKTGDWVLARGRGYPIYVDQFDDVDTKSGPPERRESTSYGFVRNPDVKRKALDRSKGHCELCNVEGFKTHAGSIYLETHHIQPLAAGGSDTIDNVIALCPNDHRRAHFSEDSETIKVKLFERVKERNRK